MYIKNNGIRRLNKATNLIQTGYEQFNKSALSRKKHYEEETNKTNTQNSIYYCQHKLFVLRALDSRKSMDNAAT